MFTINGPLWLLRCTCTRKGQGWDNSRDGMPRAEDDSTRSMVIAVKWTNAMSEHSTVRMAGEAGLKKESSRKKWWTTGVFYSDM